LRVYAGVAIPLTVQTQETEGAALADGARGGRRVPHGHQRREAGQAPSSLLAETCTELAWRARMALFRLAQYSP
jgi:hypothetical protein